MFEIRNHKRRGQDMFFCRVDDKPIRLREPVFHSDALTTQDATLPEPPGLFDGCAPDEFVRRA